MLYAIIIQRRCMSGTEGDRERVAEHNIGAKVPHRGDFAEIMKADNGGSTFPGNKKERRPIVRISTSFMVF